MLMQLTIQNFAITASADVELKPGMTAITGETGAGKSIMLDALGYAMGNRADSSVVKHGADRAEISAIFNIAKEPDAYEWLKQRDLHRDQDLVLRRVITNEGRSRGYINGQPVPLQQLKELGGYLIDLHSQHEHQFLMRPENHRKMLDDFAGHQQLVTKVSQSYQQWYRIKRQLQQQQGQGNDLAARIQLLQYQLNELEHLGLEPEELEVLESEQKKLSNGENIITTVAQVIQTLEGVDQGGIGQQIRYCEQQLEQLDQPELTDFKNSLESARIQMEDGLFGLNRFQDSFELDQGRLQEVNDRLNVIYDLARKHQCKPEQLYNTWQQLKKELAQLENSQVSAEELQQQLDEKAAVHKQMCKKLSASRKKATAKLDKLVTEQMQVLALKGACMETRMEPMEDNRFAAYGMEDIEFYIRTNPGQQMQPLAKTASGGELSRISLAIQVIGAQTSNIPTLIFDEVDVGISGGTAEIVGRLLRHMGDKGQVLCVTHQPQVASQAHQHLKVEKKQTRNDTQVKVKTLKPDSRVEEIARMLGGVQITDQTLAHAQEMVNLGQLEH